MNWAKGRKTKGRGTSFRGALQYVLHDKKAETSSRVGFIEMANLATDNPKRAWREMMALCDAADQLKARAGIATRRPLEKPVYAFTLNWHEEDRPDAAHMKETAREALSALGLEHHQALIVEHTDTPHRHVHIIVNLVDPETGKAASLSNDNHKLDRWADTYELKQGMIRSPARRAKFDALDNGRPPPKRPAQSTSREEWEARKLKGDKAKQRADEIKAAYALYVDRLRATQNNAHQVRTAQAAKLWNAYQADKKAVRDRYQPFLDAIWKSKRKAPPHPYTEQALRDLQDTAEWKELGSKQFKNRRTFNARERSLLGVLVNAVRLHHSKGDATGWDMLKLVVSRRSRIEQFNRMQEGQKQALRQKQAQTRKVRADTLKAAERFEMQQLAKEFQQNQAGMKLRHGMEIAGQKAAWRLLAAARKQLWDDYRREFEMEEQDAARSSTGRQFANAAAKPEAPSPAPEQQGWKARRSAAERKADGTYRPRTRDPGRSRRRRPD